MAALDIDESMADGLMSGTFRWSKKKKLHTLPKFPSSASSVEVEKGWGAYLRTRDPSGSLTAVAQKDSSLLDCLTFPISVVYWIKKLEPWLRSGSKQGDRTGLNVVVLGATSKAEERVLLETSCWQELGLLLPDLDLHLCMIGPEVSASTDAPKTSFPLPPNLSVQLRRTEPPCAKAALSPVARRELLRAERTVFVTFNGGFGNFVDSGSMGLLWSWLEDLRALAESEAPCLFFCANDYADVRGESAVQANIVGARFLVAPQLNPYHAGSTFQGEDGGSWFCANHSAYLVCGHEATRAVQVAPEEAATPKERRRGELRVMQAVYALEKLDWSKVMAGGVPERPRYQQQACEGGGSTQAAMVGGGRRGANAGKGKGGGTSEGGVRREGGRGGRKVEGGGGEEEGGGEEKAASDGRKGDGKDGLDTLASEFEEMFEAAATDGDDGSHVGGGICGRERKEEEEAAQRQGREAEGPGAGEGGWREGGAGKVQYSVVESEAAYTARVRALEEGLDVRQLSVEVSDGELRLGPEGGEWSLQVALESAIEVDSVAAKFLRKKNELQATAAEVSVGVSGLCHGFDEIFLVTKCFA